MNGTFLTGQTLHIDGGEPPEARAQPTARRTTARSG